MFSLCDTLPSNTGLIALTPDTFSSTERVKIGPDLRNCNSETSKVTDMTRSTSYCCKLQICFLQLTFFISGLYPQLP
jgi:hypothetical protein